MGSLIGVLGSKEIPSGLGASSQGVTNGSMSQMMQKLGDALVQFQSVVMAVEQKSTGSRFQISDTVVDVIKTVTDEFCHAMKAYAAAKEEQDSLSGAQKDLSIVMDSLQIFVAGMSGNFGMAAMTATLMALNLSGAIKGVENDISADLQKNQHLSPSEANLVADSIVIAIVMVTTLLGMGLTKAASALREVSSVEEEAAEADSTQTQAPKGWKAPLLLATSQAVMNTSFASDMGKCIAGNTSENNKWKVELTVELIIGVLASIAGCAAFKSLSTSTEAATATATRAVGNSGRFSRLLAQASQSLESFSKSTTGTTLFKGANLATGATLVAQSASGSAQGVISLHLAELAKESASAQSNTAQYKGLLNLSQVNFGNYLSAANNVLRGVNAVMNEIGTAFTAVNAEESRSFH